MPQLGVEPGFLAHAAYHAKVVGRHGFGKQDQAFVGQLGDGDLRLTRQRVARGNAGDEGLGGDGLRAHARRWRHGMHQSQIDLAGLQRPDLVDAVEFMQVHAHVGVLGAHAFQRFGQAAVHARAYEAQAQAAGHAQRHRARIDGRAARSLQNVTRLHQQVSARVGQAHAAAVALEQLGVQRAFELLDGNAQRRLHSRCAARLKCSSSASTTKYCNWRVSRWIIGGLGACAVIGPAGAVGDGLISSVYRSIY